MKKLLIAIVLALLVNGCSSTQKTEPVVSTAGPKAGSSVPLPVQADGAQAQMEGDAGNPKSELYKKLSEALRGSRALNVQDEAARILVMNPDDVVALNALAMWNYRQKKVGAARLLLARAIEKGKPSPTILNNYGLTLLSEGDELAASEQFKAALRLDERHAEANANLGSHYAKGGDWQKALPRLEIAWRAGRQDNPIANNYALALKGTGDTEKARQIFDEASKRNNKDPILLLNYAGLLIETLNRPKEGLALVYRVKFLETERKEVLNRATALERKATGTSTP